MSILRLGLPVLAVGAVYSLISYIGKKLTVEEPLETVKKTYIENSTVKSDKTEPEKTVNTVEKDYIEKSDISKVMSELGKRSAEARRKKKVE